jgi:cell division septal protein FtsQ
MEHPLSSEKEPEKVISPFSNRQTEVSPTFQKMRRRWIWIATGGLFLVLLGAILAVVAVHYLNDPYRTLEEFPVDRAPEVGPEGV